MKIPAQTPHHLFDHPMLRELKTFARDQGVQLYLVGGSVRDLCLGRETADLDFTLASDAIQFAKAFADRIGATAIALEEHPPTARVIVKQHSPSHPPKLSMDFAQFRAASLTDDLRLRDLTINAMAIAFENVETFTYKERKRNALPVIDPCGGLKDLETGLLRFPSEQVVIADPVRLLRIYRFAAQLDFEISQDAIDLVRAYRSRLSDVAGERCRDELMKIFYVGKARRYLQQMEAVGLLAQLVSRIKETHRGWIALERFEENPMPTSLHAYRKEIDRYLQEEVSVEMDRRSLIKLSLLVADDVAGIGERLRFSRKAVQFMACLISGSEVLKNIIPQLTQNVKSADSVDRGTISAVRGLSLGIDSIHSLSYIPPLPGEGVSPKKQINRFLRTYASEWWGVLLYAAALYPMDSEILIQIAGTYYEHILPICKQGRLITGDDLIQEFHLKEGKQIGELLQEIENRQFDGEIRTREEAYAAVAALIRKHR